MIQRKNYLLGIDSIRGLLALFVAYAHTFGHVTGWNSGLSFVAGAPFAVDVFFAISGMVLLNAYHEKYRGSLKGAAQFLLIRFLRLWPLHVVSLVAIVVLYIAILKTPVPAWIAQDVWRDLGRDLLMMNGVGLVTPAPINHPSWSVSVEFWTGSLFMLLCFASKRLALIGGALWGGWLLLYAEPSVKDHLSLLPIGLSMGSVRCLVAMAIGGLAFECFKHREVPKILANTVVWVALLLIFSNVLSAPVTSKPMFLSSIVLVSIGLVCLPRSDASALLEHGSLRLLGTLSYSIYLVHVPVTYAVINTTQDRSVSTVHWIVAMTLLLSYAAHRWIERPFIRWGQRWVGSAA